MMRLSTAFIVSLGSLVLLALATETSAAETITETNWLHHSDIEEVREIYRAVQEARDAGELTVVGRYFDYCEPYVDTERRLTVDSVGRPRVYFAGGGSDDSAVDMEFTYDGDGVLRFAFITAGAFNGTRLEHRVYFSRQGKKIWEVQKLLEGPGYTFPTVWPEFEFVLDPKAAFRAANPCMERMERGTP